MTCPEYQSRVFIMISVLKYLFKEGTAITVDDFYEGVVWQYNGDIDFMYKVIFTDCEDRYLLVGASNDLKDRPYYIVKNNKMNHIFVKYEEVTDEERKIANTLRT
jgi:hypothetical protein